MIYAYRTLYIAGVFVLVKLLSLAIDVPVSELASYVSLVILADILSLDRLRRILVDAKKETPNE